MPAIKDVDLPQGRGRVSVKVIQAVTKMAGPAPYCFDEATHPKAPGQSASPPLFTTGSYSFLLEHEPSNKKILFDLGGRKDGEKDTPALAQMLQHFEMTVEDDVATQLEKGDVSLDAINEIVWSHSHFDHIGDPSTFPTSTSLLVGPGTLNDVRPGYPQNPEALHADGLFEGRKVNEVKFDNSLQIGGFPASDYFGDGSFYLLDTPGHCIGHIAGLARVTPTTFVLMGGDFCHHNGQLRPSPYVSIPPTLASSLLPYLRQAYEKSPKSPFLRIPAQQPSAYYDLSQAQETLEGLMSFDAHPDVLVVLAHECSMDEELSLFPRSIDDWKEEGLKERTFWNFLKPGNRAYRF